MVSSCGCSVRETLPEIGHARVSPMIGGYVIESVMWIRRCRKNPMLSNDQNLLIVLGQVT